MRKAARAFVAEHAFFRGTAISQVRQVLSEQRKAEDAEYRRQHAPPEPAPVQIVASEHVPAVKRAKAAQRRAETRRTLQTEGPSTPAQTALDLLLAGGRARPPEKPDSDGECQADRLMRFGHAG